MAADPAARLGAYAVRREIHLIAGRNPNGTPAARVLAVLLNARDAARGAVGNDNARAA